MRPAEVCDCYIVCVVRRLLWLMAAAASASIVGFAVGFSGCESRERGGSSFSAMDAPPIEVSSPRRSLPPIVYSNEAVACDHPAASQAGAEILASGGNAVDAAVAASFALSVVRPESCGVGGGGFMVIHLASHPARQGAGPMNVALDYRERCPEAIGPDHFETLAPDASRFSGHAVAVPGTVAGLLYALARFGTMDRAEVLGPATRLARDGWRPDQHTFSSTESLASTLDGRESSPLRGDSFLRETYLLAAGPSQAAAIKHIVIRNEPHAALLERLARQGRAGFYQGPVAAAILETIRDSGGLMSAEDLAAFRPKEARPLTGSFRQRTVITMPLPSSGGITLLEVLAMVEQRPELIASERRASDPESIHALAEVFKRAFADRAAFLGDPEFSPDPTAALLDPARLRRRAASIDPVRAAPPDQTAPGPLADDAGTSHLCVVDRFGNAVACTETINLEFGSRIAVPEFGFCLNNEMDDFQARRGAPNAFGLVQSDRNLPGPGKRPLSSMTPTIVLDPQGQVELVVGASGGPRIITGVAQVILNIMLYGMSAADAVAEPRIHHQWLPDRLSLEWPAQSGGRSNREAPLTAAWPRSALEQRGHALHNIDPYDASSAVQAIYRSRGGWEAACDPRKGGAPAGR